MIITKEGLFFITITQVKNPGKESVFQFTFNHDEKYFTGCKVKGAFEYAEKKIITVVNDSANIRFIDRNAATETEEMRIPNISNSSDFYSLLPFPNYDYQTFPYVLIKDSKGLSAINVLTMQARVIFKNSPLSWDVMRTSLMDVESKGDSAIVVYNVELLKKAMPNSSRREYTSHIRKLQIDVESLQVCFK